MNSDVAFIFGLLSKETWRRSRLVVFLYLLTSVLFAGLAWIWPQVYTSSTTILVDDKNVIKPLLNAPKTTLTEPTKLAQSILGSREVLHELLVNTKQVTDQTSDLEIESLMAKLQANTTIVPQGKKIVQISFTNKNPMHAYKMTKIMGEIFIRDSQSIKIKDSQAAYNFINKQALSYEKKIKDADEAIKEFRSKNIDSTPGALKKANDRMLNLTRQIEDLEIEILGDQSKLTAQKNQLAGGEGAENSASVARETVLRARIADLNGQLENLRLTFKDTYPDIVQIKGQIDSTNELINKEIESRHSGVRTEKESLSDSPLAQQLRSDMLKTKTDISTKQSRLEQLKILLTKEQLKVNRINAVESEISGLTMDSVVNKRKYDELIAQRENARITKEMDEAGQGLNASVQEAAFLPATPQGLRFMHIMIAGFLLSFLVPLGVVFGLSLLDQKIRDMRVFEQALDLTVLARIRPVISDVQAKKNRIKSFYFMAVIFLSWSIYGYEIWLRGQA